MTLLDLRLGRIGCELMAVSGGRDISSTLRVLETSSLNSETPSLNVLETSSLITARSLTPQKKGAPKGGKAQGQKGKKTTCKFIVDCTTAETDRCDNAPASSASLSQQPAPLVHTSYTHLCFPSFPFARDSSAPRGPPHTLARDSAASSMWATSRSTSRRGSRFRASPGISGMPLPWGRTSPRSW